MRDIITACVPALTLPPAEDRAAANLGPSTRTEHDHWVGRWPALSTLEHVDPPLDAAVAEPAGTIRVVAWNLERCKHVEASAEVLRAAAADIVLATEMDHGCARSGQRHTTADLAAELGFGYVFGVEFVELALGDARETAAHAGTPNRHGLHGNAVLSRWPITAAALIPLDDGAAWYENDLKQGQRRIGGRNGIAALIATPGGPVAVAAVHFESESTPRSRAVEAARLLRVFDSFAAGAPAIIGGDFNVAALSRAGLDAAAMLAVPEEIEPTFAAFADHGFDWRDANLPGVTTRKHPHDDPAKPDIKIDWLFVRRLVASAPWIGAALGPDGTVLSDHEPIGVDIRPVAA